MGSKIASVADVDSMIKHELRKTGRMGLGTSAMTFLLYIQVLFFASDIKYFKS
jgi:hypothetical protein